MDLDKQLAQVLMRMGKQDAYQPIDEYRRLARKPSTHVDKDVYSYRFQPRRNLLLLPLYDLHFGLKFCAQEMLERCIDYIYHTEDCYTVLGGDALETATRDSIGMGVMEQRLHLQQQRRQLEALLRPLAQKQKILGGITGNHEYRQQKFSDDNPMSELCYDLGIPFWGYSAFLKLWVGEQLYRVHLHHGASGAVTKGGKTNAALKFRNISNVDLTISGHTHDQIVTHDLIYEIDENEDKLVPRRRTYVVAGGFVNYFGSYSEMKAYEPAPMGPVLIELASSQKHVSVHML